MMIERHTLSMLAACLAVPSLAQAQSQNAPPRIDPGIAVRTAQEPAPPPERSNAGSIASPPATSSGPLSSRITAGAIEVDGADDLAPEQLTAATAPFVGHHLSADDVQDLLTAVSGVARARGYVFARSSIPAQTASDGVLHVRLDEGRVDSIRITGEQLPAAAAILQPLQGHAPKRDEIERRLLLVGDLPGITVGQVRYALEPSGGVLIVPITRSRISGSATFDNRGLDALGPERARLAVDVHGLVSDRDQLSFEGLTTPIQPRELLALFGRYSVQPTAFGTELAVYGSFGETHSGGQSRFDDPWGTSGSVGVSAAQVLARGAKTSLWLQAEGDWVGVNDWYRGVLTERDRVTTLGVSINGYTPLAGGRLRAGGGVTQGVLALGATPRDNPLASRYDAGSDFTLFSAWASWQGNIAGPFSAKLATTSQVTTDPLPAVEQLTIGGPYFGRGYNFSERTGDEGILGSAELRADVLRRNKGFLRWAQLYTFGDAGYVSNLESAFGTGDLYSAGAGARLSFGPQINLELEAAFPINAIRYDSGDKSPRLSISLTGSF